MYFICWSTTIKHIHNTIFTHPHQCTHTHTPLHNPYVNTPYPFSPPMEDACGQFRENTGPLSFWHFSTENCGLQCTHQLMTLYTNPFQRRQMGTRSLYVILMQKVQLLTIFMITNNLHHTLTHLTCFHTPMSSLHTNHHIYTHHNG